MTLYFLDLTKLDPLLTDNAILSASDLFDKHQYCLNEKIHVGIDAKLISQDVYRLELPESLCAFINVNADTYALLDRIQAIQMRDTWVLTTNFTPQKVHWSEKFDELYKYKIRQLLYGLIQQVR